MARLRGARFEINWIDNERTRQYRRLPFKRQIQNLSQLNRDQRLLGPSERLRFLVRYAREMGLSKSDRRAIFDQVRRHSRRRGRALLQKFRPVEMRLGRRHVPFELAFG